MVYAVAWEPISRAKDLKAMCVWGRMPLPPHERAARYRPHAATLVQAPTCRGFADSKTLTEEKRERLYETIQREAGVLGHEADVLSAALISGAPGVGRQSSCKPWRGSPNCSALWHETGFFTPGWANLVPMQARC